MKKKSTWFYISCLVIGALIGYYFIRLKPVDTDVPKVDVKVEVPEPVVIRDTITNTEIKYKYIYKDRCSCECCIKDTIK